MPTVCTTYVALKLRGLLEMKLLWCVRNHVVVTLTLLKFLLVAVLQGIPSRVRQLSTVNATCLARAYSISNEGLRPDLAGVFTRLQLFTFYHNKTFGVLCDRPMQSSVNCELQGQIMHLDYADIPFQA